MMMTRVLIIWTLLVVAQSWAQSRSGQPPSRTSSQKAATTSVYHYPRTKHASHPRTETIEIKQSRQARSEFVRTHPCPSTGKTSGSCRGYVVDHVVPLELGGVDAPSNMRWQTKAAAKVKGKG
jgi:hypothetical protein